MKLLLIATDLVRLTLAAALLITCWWLSWLAIEPVTASLSIAAGVYAAITLTQVVTA